MSDVGSVHFVKAGEGSGRVLVPQPSDSPHDPLVSVTATTDTRFKLTIEELEPFLEDFSNIIEHNVLVCARVWSFGPCPYVSAVDGSLRF